MVKLTLRKLVEAILSAFMLGVIMAAIHYQPPHENYPEALTFEGTFLLVFLFSSVFFVIGGIPFSILIEKMMKKINFRYQLVSYLISMILYIFAGLLAGIVLALLIGFDLDRQLIIEPSLLGGACFYVVSLCLNKLIQLYRK